MNIFYLDKDPHIAATYHSDKHVIKMILESAQLLSTAHRVLDGQLVIERDRANRRIKRYKFNDERDEIFYKSTHVNHPSAVWVRESTEHYRWLALLFAELLHEYTYRYGKTHASSRLLETLIVPPTNLVDRGFTPPPPAMDKEYILPDTVSSYRNYYCKAKSDLLQYTKRPAPDWIKDY